MEPLILNRHTEHVPAWKAARACVCGARISPVTWPSPGRRPDNWPS